MSTDGRHHFVLRRMCPEEFDKLHDLFPDSEELWEEYRAMRLVQLEARETDVYVIEHDSKFVGEASAHYVSRDLPAEAIPQQRAYLSTFRVDEQHQGEGLGQKLLRFVLSDLERQGYTEFTVGVDESNAVAKHIYSKLGFADEVGRGSGDRFDPTDYTLYLRSLTGKQEAIK